MRVLPVAALAAFLASLLLPAASAYPQPAFYFLKSGCPSEEVEGLCPVPEASLPAAPPLPPPVPPTPGVGVPKFVVADGVLDPYDFLHPNAPNSTEPDLKPVYTASEETAPVRFLTPDNHTHPGRLKGYFIVGVYTGYSAVPNGNLTATIYEVLPDGTEVALLNATAAIDLNTSKAPDPTTLVPPNSTDPATIVLYEVAKVAPLVLTPPNVYLLGPVDLNFSNTSRLAIGFHLAQGSSQSPEPPGAATVSFNSTLNPSFLYVPWYAPDPPRSTSSKTFSSTRSFSSTRTGTRTLTGSDEPGAHKEKHGIPGFEMATAVLLVAVAAWVTRRRLE